MTRTHTKLLAAVIAATAMLVTPAFAQPKPKNYDPGRSEDAKKNDEAFDKQFRARQDGPQDAAPKADPWGDVRSDPAKSATAEKKPKK